MVVVQHAAQSLPPLYRTARSQVTRLGKNDSIGQPLMISLEMIMRDELGHRPSEVSFAYWDHPVETLFLMERTNRSAYAFAFGA